MMICFPTKINLDQLALEVNALKFKVDGSGALMAFPQSVRIDSMRLTRNIIDAIAEVAEARKHPPLYLTINVLQSGVVVPKHSDTLKGSSLQPNKPKLERWHLPIITNDDSWWWDESHGQVSMAQGFWHGPVPYWIQHQVGNLGSTSRIHMVVDLDSPEVQA